MTDGGTCNFSIEVRDAEGIPHKERCTKPSGHEEHEFAVVDQ